MLLIKCSTRCTFGDGYGGRSQGANDASLLVFFMCALIIDFFASFMCSTMFLQQQTWTFGADRKFSESKENLATNTGSISPTVPISLVSSVRFVYHAFYLFVFLEFKLLHS